MYNRSEEYYKVISCENDSFDIYTSKVMDTGFELGILISDIVKPEYPKKLQEKERELLDKHQGETDRTGYSEDWTRFICTSPYREMWNDYYTRTHPINVEGYSFMLITDEKVERAMNPGGIPVDNQTENTEGCYVVNSNGKKFKSTMSPSRKSKYNFIEGNKFDFYETFGMTKYDATDRISLVIEFLGEPVKIELEKIK